MEKSIQHINQINRWVGDRLTDVCGVRERQVRKYLVVDPWGIRQQGGNSSTKYFFCNPKSEEKSKCCKTCREWEQFWLNCQEIKFFSWFCSLNMEWNQFPIDLSELQGLNLLDFFYVSFSDFVSWYFISI